MISRALVRGLGALALVSLVLVSPSRADVADSGENGFTLVGPSGAIRAVQAVRGDRQAIGRPRGYSTRRASIGSRAAARRAGKRLAAALTSASSAAPITRVRGSPGLSR